MNLKDPPYCMEEYFKERIKELMAMPRKSIAKKARMRCDLCGAPGQSKPICRECEKKYEVKCEE